MEVLRNRRELVARTKLADALPLRTPYTIYVDPSSACNFRCNFCYHSIDNQDLKALDFSKQIMDLGLYRQIMDAIEEFPDRLKMLSLFIKGEPLLNPRLPEMVALAKSRGLADRIYITSNGALLTPALGRDLVAAGLNELLISVEAVDKAEYRAITGVDVDFDALVEQVEAFYQYRGNCKLFVKCITYAQDEDKVKRFHEIFDPICQLAYVEQVVPVFDRVDYKSLDLDHSKLKSLGKEIHACTRPFFNMCVHANGEIGACLADYVPEVSFGNVKVDSLYEVWNGQAFTEFRLMHLKRLRYGHAKCGHCVSPGFDSQESDLLDEDAERLVRLYTGQLDEVPLNDEN